MRKTLNTLNWKIDSKSFMEMHANNLSKKQNQSPATRDSSQIATVLGQSRSHSHSQCAQDSQISSDLTIRCWTLPWCHWPSRQQVGLCDPIPLAVCEGSWKSAKAGLGSCSWLQPLATKGCPVCTPQFFSSIVTSARSRPGLPQHYAHQLLTSQTFLQKQQFCQAR